MIIADQLLLFYRKIREAQTNSRIEPTEAIARINDAREEEAGQGKFYRISDTITAGGGETYWTLRDDFLGPIAARDWATINGKAITIKSKADWASKVQGAVVPALGLNEVWGMLDGNTFYIYPSAAAGDVLLWYGYALPPALPDITGPDAYLTNPQARLTVMVAAAQALEDLGASPGKMLLTSIAEQRKQVKDKAKVRGARLENAPEE